MRRFTLSDRNKINPPFTYLQLIQLSMIKEAREHQQTTTHGSVWAGSCLTQGVSIQNINMVNEWK